MTTCTTFSKSIKRRVEEGKTLDQIAGELCTDVKNGRAKVVRVIKDFLGENFLLQHAMSLGYDVEMAQKAKKRTAHKKISAPASSGSKHKQPDTEAESVCEDFTLIEAVRILIDQFGYDAVLETVKQEGDTQKLQIKN